MDIKRAPKSKKKRNIYIGLGAVALLVVTFLLSQLEPAAPTADRNVIVLGTVERGEMVREVRGSGTLVPERVQFVAAVTAGRVESVHFEPGQTVSASDVLVVLSNPDVELQVLEAEQQWTAARATLVSLRQTLGPSDYLDYIAGREYALDVGAQIAHGAVRFYAMAETALLERRGEDAAAALARVALANPDHPRLPFLNAQVAQIQLRDNLDSARAAIRDGRLEDASTAIDRAWALNVTDTSEIDLVEDELRVARGDQCIEEVLALAGKARDRKLSPADMRGGCFTISSLGNIGGTGFTPIVNAPEVAILGVSRATLQPVWDGQIRDAVQIEIFAHDVARRVSGGETDLGRSGDDER